MIESMLTADLVADLPQAIRLQRLVSGLRAHFQCGAVALLRLEETHLRPVAVDGLVRDALGRRFAVSEHPRLATILARRELVSFDHDSTLPDPYDGLIDTRVGEPLPVHDCMGISLHIEGQPWGALTLDALQVGAFDEAAREKLRRMTALVEASIRVTRLEAEIRSLRLAHHNEPLAVPPSQEDSEIVGQ
ncbi:MAG TPA: GAF domain-containing protein, partial [Burkholderiales bacterium]|nr:GAF domain-containing protein [Burkholderiales bacterium]